MQVLQSYYSHISNKYWKILIELAFKTNALAIILNHVSSYMLSMRHIHAIKSSGSYVYAQFLYK